MTSKWTDFWNERPVLITGHTGFKGAWLSLWLGRMGARVTGYALEPPSDPNLFTLAGLEADLRDIRADVRDPAALEAALESTRPEVVFHLAAQSLVRESYVDPVGTYATNVMGTVHLLDAVRRAGSVQAVVVVTSDKCYENREWDRGYREEDALGGFDPYSSSKGCAELVTAAFRRSFFGAEGPLIASARAGNVIGGGDWAKDRLLPDLLKAFSEGRPAMIRNPMATRPWQHVLEPLRGYLMLAERLLQGEREAAESWNFGPAEAEVRPVSWVADRAAAAWAQGASWRQDLGAQPHEARSLMLDAAKAEKRLGWRSFLDAEESVAWTVRWFRDQQLGLPARELALRDICEYEDLIDQGGKPR